MKWNRTLHWNKTIRTASSKFGTSESHEGTRRGCHQPQKLKTCVPYYEPIKLGSANYKKPTSEQALPVYVESLSTIVRNI